ncbi:cytosolic thiouridylase subunit Ctu1 [Coemansia spiralis]|uniref:Cytoplasmic tRNA 2-thiolation protein 1 n=2 Tax=Coemansia TaxID=4863 RepID=A0A9W8G3V4_9FUNG|nr:cytoplasmic tRNA 2-thiolation protein 1 [Coemansia spiralis]KAJ1988227.1 cytosolic thiouridylase subunit Ctu1 [Coemansia umbellata]KAJ2619624.1 cytosolic thiouridylase subunit Ctu1 [Coemansia sp. RSA 1358]KAJ2671594.1 cytosolic thiouridylase subunit Ctu1 [Coemansia spiralis]
MPRQCEICNNARAILRRPKTGQRICNECFFYVFETEIHNTIVDNKLFKPGDRVGIGASGGKDSTVLAYVMKTLNNRYNYGLDLYLLSVDEGISGYRDDSLETVKRNKEQYGLPLLIVSYEQLYGWSMDSIVEAVGRKNNCTFCGVFRRQALDRGALMLDLDHIVTGHNADDVAETILMNLFRGDLPRLGRCTEIVTAGDGYIGRSKPFKYAYEKEIVMYAYLKHLDYFSTECTYSPNAYRGYAREFLKDLEFVRPSAILDIIHSGEAMQVASDVQLPTLAHCERCGYISSNALCKACILLEGLERGVPKLGIAKSARHAQELLANESAMKSAGKAVEPVHFELLRGKAQAMREQRQMKEQQQECHDCTATSCAFACDDDATGLCSSSKETRRCACADSNAETNAAAS